MPAAGTHWASGSRIHPMSVNHSSRQAAPNRRGTDPRLATEYSRHSPGSSTSFTKSSRAYAPRFSRGCATNLLAGTREGGYQCATPEQRDNRGIEDAQRLYLIVSSDVSSRDRPTAAVGDSTRPGAAYCPAATTQGGRRSYAAIRYQRLLAGSEARWPACRGESVATRGAAVVMDTGELMAGTSGRLRATGRSSSSITPALREAPRRT